MTVEEARAFIAAVPWKDAASTRPFAPHSYVTIRAVADDEAFWAFVNFIRANGRQEIWTPPREWVARWGGRPQRNTYWYHGEHAFWFTWPRNSIPMINKEHVSVQERTPTRRPVGEQGRF